jgi:serine/threonine-protein kinase RsbW
VSPTLCVHADLGQLAEVRRFVEQHCADWGLPGTFSDPLVLALDELTTNVIEHGYQGQPGEIEVELAPAGDRLVVRLRDQAPLFDPTQLPTPDVTLPLSQRRPGGMGIYLARRSVDEMTYAVTPRGGNQLTLIKRTGRPQTRTPNMDMSDEQAQANVPVTILRLAGEVDGSNYRQLIERVKTLYEAGTRHLLLDLSGVPYMSSAGLVALHSASLLLQQQPLPDTENGWRAIRGLGQAGGSGRQPYVKLLQPQPRVAGVLEQTGLLKYFEVFQEEAAALASF